MLLHPKLLGQTGNIYQNKSKAMINLVFKENPLFYKELDRLVEEGRRIQVYIRNEILTDESQLLKKIALCHNGSDFLARLAEILSDLPEAIIAISMKDIFRMLKVLNNIGNKGIYASYCVRFAYDKQSDEYSILLEPMGDGIDPNRLVWLM